MANVYVCPNHEAVWDVGRQGIYCPACNKHWTEHDVPALLQRIRELETQLKEKEVK